MGRTKKTIEKQPEPKGERPYWKDENRISAAWRLATANCKHLNSVILPLCETCGLPISEQMREYIGNLGAIEEDYITSVQEQMAGVTDFLADAIEEQARKRFAGFVESLSNAMKRNKPREKESYYKLGGLCEVTKAEVLETIKLEGQYFRVDFSAIEALYTHYLDDVEIAKYERQKAAAKALNDFFRGDADSYSLQAAFYIAGGEIFPNTSLNYKRIK